MVKAAKLPTDPGPAAINAALDVALAQVPPEVVAKIGGQDVENPDPAVLGLIGNHDTGLPTPPGEPSASAKIYEATSHIREAAAELDKLQRQYAPENAAWAQCETIDDHLFEALRLLGD